MKLPHITMLAALLLTAPAAAQLQITPPAATPGAPAEKQKPAAHDHQEEGGRSRAETFGLPKPSPRPSRPRP